MYAAAVVSHEQSAFSGASRDRATARAHETAGPILSDSKARAPESSWRNPPVPTCWKVEQRVLRLEEGYRRILVRDPFVARINL